MWLETDHDVSNSKVKTVMETAVFLSMQQRIILAIQEHVKSGLIRLHLTGFTSHSCRAGTCPCTSQAFNSRFTSRTELQKLSVNLHCISGALVAASLCVVEPGCQKQDSSRFPAAPHTHSAQQASQGAHSIARNMSRAVVLSVLLLQLALQPAVLAACQTAQQQDLLLLEQTGEISLGHERQLTALGGRSFGGFGGSRVSSRPAGGVVTGRPVTGPVVGRPVAPAGRTFGSTALPGGYSAYGRSGFRSTPFILPLAIGGGLLAGSALASLNRDPSAYCNGVTVQCYQAACEEALRNRCPDAASALAAANVTNTLVLSACPDTRYSECYRTTTFNDTAAPSFECFGVRRPSRTAGQNLAAVCHQPGGSNSAGTASVSKVGLLT